MNEDIVKLAEEYASMAQKLLEEQGEPYTEEDIAKVAEFLIDNDYPSEDGVLSEQMSKISEEDYEKLAEEAFILGFEDELEKQAKLPTPNQVAADFGAYILSKLFKNPSALKPDGFRAKVYNYLVKHPKTLGYGTAMTGAAGVGAAAIGTSRLMQKKSSFEKSAFSPNQSMRDLAEWIAKNTQGPVNHVLVAPNGAIPPATLRDKVTGFIRRNPLKTGYGTVGLGVLGIGGTSAGIYNAMRE